MYSSGLIILVAITFINSLYFITSLKFSLQSDTMEYDYLFCMTDKDNIHGNVKCPHHLDRVCASIEKSTSKLDYNLCSVRKLLNVYSTTVYHSSVIFLIELIISIGVIMALLFALVKYCLNRPRSVNDNTATTDIIDIT